MTQSKPMEMTEVVTKLYTKFFEKVFLRFEVFLQRNMIPSAIKTLGTLGMIVINHVQKPFTLTMQIKTKPKPVARDLRTM